MKNSRIYSNPMEISSKYLHTYNIDVALDNGDTHIYTVATRNEVKSLEDLPRESGDAVTIIASSPERDRMLLIREYRPPINGYVWAFPAGLIDPDDASFEVAAARELKEETGYNVVSVDDVLRPSYSSPGMTNESVAFIYMTVDPEQENVKQHLEASEDIHVRWVNRAEAQEILCGAEAIDQRAALVLHEFIR